MKKNIRFILFILLIPLLLNCTGTKEDKDVNPKSTEEYELQKTKILKESEKQMLEKEIDKLKKKRDSLRIADSLSQKTPEDRRESDPRNL